MKSVGIGRVTGTPEADTPPTTDSSDRLATTSFVQKLVGAITYPVTSVFGRTGAVLAQSGDYSVGQITGAAPLSSPVFTGDPKAPTAAAGDNDTSIATTAFVQTALGSAPGTAITYNTITANVNVVGTNSGTATSIISSTSKTYDGTQVVLEFYAAAVATASVSASTFNIGLYESGTLIALIGQLITPAAGSMTAPVLLRYLFTPSAATHSYTVAAWVSSTTGTPHVAAGSGTGGATAPAHLRITKA